MTGNVFFNVSPKNIFYLFLLETALNDKLTVSVDRTACS